MNADELIKELEVLSTENLRLREENAALREEGEALRTELAGAQAQVAIARELFVQLTARIERLEGQAAKDSHNSSQPPSSDGPTSAVQKTKSLRGKSGKQSGGQPGHAGHTLLMVQEPETIVALVPAVCDRCRHSLELAEVRRVERAQVWDLPPLRLHVTEYRAQVKTCPACQAETRAAFPDGIVASAAQYGPMTRALAVYLHCLHLLPYARTCQILSDVLGTTFSQASLQAALQCGSQHVEEALGCIKQGLMGSPVMHNDETGFRIAGKGRWLHVAATTHLTYYQYHEKRGKAATDAMGILPSLQGMSVHDSWASYLEYACTHALCNVHYLRELTFISERYKQQWAQEMKDLLLSIKAQVDLARALGKAVLPRAMRQQYEARYQHLVEQGMAANPPPPRKKAPAARCGETMCATCCIACVTIKP